MKILSNIRRAVGKAILGEQASIITSRDLMLELDRGHTAITGASITSETAMRVSAVSRAVRIISGTIASMPLITYRRVNGDGKKRATDNPVYKLLRYKPNGWQTSMEFREMMQAHALLRGGAYALKTTVNGRPDELLPLHPDCMQVSMKSGEIVYDYTVPGTGEPKRYYQDQIFHLRGLSFDGINGRSAIDDHRESIGLATTQEAYGAYSYARGGTKRIFLSHPNKLTEDAANRLRDSWEDVYGGQKNMHKVGVVEEGMKPEAISMTAEDMDYIEARRFQIGDIARIFGVPLPLMQEGEKGTAWGSGIEQLSLMFLIYTLQPWLVRWEQAIQRDILGQDQEEYFAEHLVDVILRADIEKRWAAHGIAIDKGVFNADEIRAMENRNPQPNGQGKVYHVPSTWTPKEKSGQTPAPAADPREQPAPGQDGQEDPQ